MTVYFGIFIFIILGSTVTQPWLHKNDAAAGTIISLSPLLIGVVAFFCALPAIAWRDRAQSKKLGFVCKNCGEPLYNAENIYGSGNSVRVTGCCAKCNQKAF